MQTFVKYFVKPGIILGTGIGSINILNYNLTAKNHTLLQTSFWCFGVGYIYGATWPISVPFLCACKSDLFHIKVKDHFIPFSLCDYIYDQENEIFNFDITSKIEIERSKINKN